MKPINYIKIDNIKNLNQINNIKLYHQGKEQAFSLSCAGCIPLDDENTSEKRYQVSDNASILLKFNKELNVDSLEVHLFIQKDEQKVVEYTLSFLNYDKEEEQIFYQYDYSGIQKNNETHKYNYNNLNKVNPKYFDEIKTIPNKTLIEESALIIKEEIYYTTIDTLYQYYDIEKEYSKIYSIPHLEDYPHCDYNDYITVYRYKRRGKVTINEDELYFTDKNQKIENLIVESNVDITITSNIDYAVNGKYKVNFITPFRVITVDVIIDIKENLLNALIEQVKINDELKNEYNTLASSINKQEENIKEIISTDSKTINKLNNELQQEKTINQELKKQKKLEGNGESLITRKQIFLPITFIILFLISLYFMFKKNVDEKN